MITVYHNSRCGKSRDALKYLEERNIPYTVVEYLKDTPDEKLLQSLLKKLNMKPHDLIRTKEAIYIENYKGKMLSDAEWIQAMVTHPILIERPVVVLGNKAVIARPTEKIAELF
ncbi:MAG TPA: arsenate reductase (glutaredoxin) [Chitinophagales bacterium]|nr:arsenate reductase (glutaredoxin) [Chitinophagales bacterium]HNL84844.1 arsenate reductase (glutaredoxin) [Chitinophagales bacterium]